MKFIIVNILGLMISISLYASGVITIKGKVYGFSKKEIMIKFESEVYSILKSSIGPNEQGKIKKIKIGDALSLTVAFDGVSSVKSLSKNK